MRKNLWIYLSCLLFCCATTHRVWQYRSERDLVKQLKMIDAKYLDELIFNYSSDLGCIKSRVEHKQYSDYYLKELAVVEYLVSHEDAGALIGLCEERAIANDGVVGFSKVNSKVMLYKYASVLVKYFQNKLDTEMADNSRVLHVESFDLSRSHEGIYGLQFNFYDKVMEEVEYIIDGKELPTLDNSVITDFPVHNLNIILNNSITGEKQKMNFYDIKA